MGTHQSHVYLSIYQFSFQVSGMLFTGADSKRIE